jgi:hypothetical protein
MGCFSLAGFARTSILPFLLPMRPENRDTYAMYEITGSITHIMEMQTFPSGFAKREFVIETNDKYPQQIKFECVKQDCALLDSRQLGEEVRVEFSIRGNAYQGRFYVNLQAHKLEPTNPFQG